MILALLVVTALQVQTEIALQAPKYGIETSQALQIAKCESTYRSDAKNPKSTALGVYQWTAPTWKYIKAKGSRENYKDNIREFMKHFKSHPNWWKNCL